MDPGDDGHHMHHCLQAQGITPVIPLKNNRQEPIADDEEQYK
jgi:hypothetical protein